MGVLMHHNRIAYVLRIAAAVLGTVLLVFQPG
jgi:hypothetical protein